MFHSPVIAHRCFFAIRPPVTLARQIANAATWFDTSGTAVRAEHLHVTLDILEDMPALGRDLTQCLLGVGEAVAAAPFRMTLDRVAGSARSIALRPSHRSDGLNALYRTIACHRTAAGVAQRPGYAFSPHLTLGYRDGPPFAERIAPVEWVVQELVLVHSHIGRTRHDVLGRWTLQGEHRRQLSLF